MQVGIRPSPLISASHGTHSRCSGKTFLHQTASPCLMRILYLFSSLRPLSPSLRHTALWEHQPTWAKSTTPQEDKTQRSVHTPQPFRQPSTWPCSLLRHIFLARTLHGMLLEGVDHLFNQRFGLSSLYALQALLEHRYPLPQFF